jgi:hypothetical protein
VVLGFSTQNVSSTRLAAAITTLAMVVSALVSLKQGNFGLQDAHVTIKLLDAILFPFWLVEPWMIRSPGLYTAHRLRRFIYLGITIFVTLLKAPCVGLNPKCNMCTASIFGSHVAYLVWYWIYSSVLMCLTAYGTLWGTGPWLHFSLISALLSEKTREDWVFRVTEAYKRNMISSQYQLFLRCKDKTRPLGFRFNWGSDDTFLSIALRGFYKLPEQQRTLKRRLSWALGIPRCQRALIALVYLTYQIVETELFVKKELDQGAQEWGYGQVAALVLISPSVMEVIRLFLWGNASDYELDRTSEIPEGARG